MPSTIKIKRSVKTPVEIATEPIKYGEPVYIDDKKWVGVGNVNNDSFGNISVTKLVNQERADKGIYYGQRTNNLVSLTDDNGVEVQVKNYNVTNATIDNSGILRFALYRNIVIPVNQWVSDYTYDYTGYIYKARVNVRGCTEKHKAEIVYDFLTYYDSPIVKTAENLIIVWMKEKPATDVIIDTLELIAQDDDIPGPGVTDLTNTYWFFNSDGYVMIPVYNKEYLLDFYFMNGDDQVICSKIKITPKGTLINNKSYVIIYEKANGTQIGVYTKDGQWDYSYGSVRSIAVTGGQDKTNVELIAWIFQNAKQLGDRNVALIDFDGETHGLVPVPKSGQSNYFLRGDGKWSQVDNFPSQSGHSGEFLTTNGSTVSWASTLPSQSGNNGKFLKTNGSSTSWEDIYPTQTGHNGDVLLSNGSSTYWGTPTKINVTENSINTKINIVGINTESQSDGLQYNNSVYINCSTGVLMGAAWNDYAEYRECKEKPGTVVCEVGDGKLVKANKRLQKGCSIISDTYGMIIGKDDDGFSPVAISGRVLVNVEVGDYFEAGDAVCSGLNGTISKMTRREIRRYPDRIIGYVSEIPTYDEWNGVKINNRIWIKVV